MPCPCFQPERVATHPAFPNARIPLIEEYDGLCRAQPGPVPVPAEMRFPGCNHGNVRGMCSRFPASEIRTSIRFDVVARESESLEILYVEEQDYAPLRWYRYNYDLSSGTIVPNSSDICVSAQLAAFCRSYERRFHAPR